MSGFSVSQTGWTYTTSQDLDFLREGETLTFSYNVVATDNSGAANAASAPTKVTITIHGTNDQPTLNVTKTSGSVTEGNGTATLTDSSQLSFADLDTNDVVTVSQTSNHDIVWSGGTIDPTLATALVSGFSVSQTGWTYTTSQDLDFLREGETITFSYNVVATDNSGAANAASAPTKVTITIHGANDTPVISTVGTDSDIAGLTEGNAGLTTNGTLTVTDVDLNDTVATSVTSIAVSGTGAGSVPATLTNAILQGYLTLMPTTALNADPSTTSNLIWNFNSGSQAFDFLAKDQTLTLTYTITGTDNSGNVANNTTTHTVAVTITGTNDAPVITSDGGGATATDTIPENTTAVTTVTATDVDTPQANLTYAITGGADANFFTINPTTGALAFKAAPDFEDPSHLPTYAVTVSVNDNVVGNPLTDSQAITVNVTDVGTRLLSGPVYVSQTFAGDTINQPVTTPDGQSATFGVNAFATLQDAFEAVPVNGTITLYAGTGPYTGGTINQPFTFSVPTDTAIISGNLVGNFALTKSGSGTLVLSGTNTYLGGTSVLRGALQVSSDAALGNASGSVSVTTPGKIQFTGNVTTSRIYALNNNSSLQVVSGTLSLNKAEIDGGVLSGPGSIITIGGLTTFNGSQSRASLSIDATVNTNFTNFTDGGALELAAGGTFSLDAFTLASSGNLTVDGTANVTDFVSNGVVTVDRAGAAGPGNTGTAVGGKLINVSTSSGLTFGGGSVTNVRGYDSSNTTPPPLTFGLIDLGSFDASLAGGLMINDGNVGSFADPGVVALDVGFGSLAEGYGAYDLINQINGGKVSPGHSPGAESFSTFNLKNGNSFTFEISNATGTAGNLQGWDLALVNGTVFNPNPTLNFFPSATYSIEIDSLAEPSNTAAPASNFNPNLPYAWKFVDGTAATITGAANFATTNFTFNVGGFLLQSGLANAANFSVEFRNTDSNPAADSLFIVYTPTAALPTVSYTGTEDTPLVTGGMGNPAGVLAGIQDPTEVVTQVNGVAISGGPVTVANGSVSMNPDGTFTYNPALNFNGPTSFTYTTMDAGGKTATGTVSITLAAVNDPPVLTLGTPSITYTDTGAFDNFLPVAATVTVSDPDGPTAVFSATGAASDSSQPGYNLSVAGTYGKLYVNSSTGAYEYVPDSVAINALITTQTDSFTLTVNDQGSPPLSDMKTLTVTLIGANDIPTIGGTISGDVTEDMGVVAGNLSTTGTLTIVDADAGQSNFTPQTNTAATLGTFSLTSAGVWTYTVDNSLPAVQQLGMGQSLTDSFTAVSSDGTASQLVTVTIHGTNDIPVIGGVSTGDVTEDVAVVGGNLSTTGTLTIVDVDQGQSNFAPQTNTAATLGTFSLTSAGVWTYTVDNSLPAVQQLGMGQSLTDSFTAVSSDGTASQLVTVTIHGTNDIPVIGGVSTGDVTEDVAVVGGNLSTTGTLTIVDADAGQSNFTPQTNTAATLGTFSLTSAGVCTYTVDNSLPAVQQLGMGLSLTDSFTAVSSDGTASQLVTVTIHGTNDIPVIGGVSTGDVTEDVAVVGGNLSTTGTLTIVDVDQGQSNFAPQTNTAATLGTFSLTSAGVWTYTVDNSLPAVQQLGMGQSLTDSFTAVSSDGTASQLVTVTIHGTNDIPVIGGVSTGDVTEDVGVVGGNLSTTGTLTIVDADAGQSNFTPQTNTAATLGTFSLTSAGVWTYTVDNSLPAVQQLGMGQSLTDSFTAVSSDGTASQLVTVTIHGTNDIPVIGGVSTGDVTEDVAVVGGNLSTTGTLTIVDVDQGQSNFAPQTNTAATLGTFSLTSAGVWTYTVDNSLPAVQQLGMGQSLTDSFTAVSSDGTASQLVTVTIHGTNDIPVIGGVSTGDVTEDVGVVGGNLSTTGTLTIVDVDQGQSNFAPQTNTAATLGTFSLTSAGVWTYTVNNSLPAVQQLGMGQSLTDSFTAVSSDGTASQLVTVTIHGTNDIPVIGGVSTGDVTEDVAVVGGNLTTTGTLTIVDVDAGQSNFAPQTNTPATLGTFSLTSAGVWTYTVDNSLPAVQQLGMGQSLTDSFTAVSSDGTASQLVTVTIHGTNDIPVIGGVSTGDVTEDVGVVGGNLSTTGTLTIVDADAGQSNFTPQTNTAATLGTFSLTSAGVWTYTVDNSLPAVQQLGMGQSLTDSFTAVSSDGTASQLVTVTIHGTNDIPVIGGVSTGDVTEDVGVVGGNLTTTGTLTIVDVDQGQSNFAPQTNTAATLGTFSLTSAGVWTYTVNNSLPAVQQLGMGQSLTDSFTAVSSDGTASQLVTVTIHGTNDIPVIGGVSTGDVTEDVGVVAGNLSTTGTLTIVDADAGQSNFAPQTNTAATLGTFSLTSAGVWTYTVDNSLPAVQQLGMGQSLTDSFTAVSSDGTASQLVTVTIHGTNDVPTITGATFFIPELSPIGTAVGTAVGNDVDVPHSLSYAIIGGSGSSDFTIDSSSGAITVSDPYVLNFELTPTFSLTVQVTDDQGAQASAAFTVNLTDVAEPILQVSSAFTGPDGTSVMGTDSNPYTIGIDAFPTIAAAIDQADATGTTIHIAAGTYSDPLSLSKHVTLATDGAVTIAGAISGSDGLVKTGTGPLVLMQTDTYSGGTTVMMGTLMVSSDDQLGVVNNATNAVTVQPGATIEYTASTQSSRQFHLNMMGASSGTLDVDGAGTTLTFVGAEVDGGVLAGTGSIVTMTTASSFNGVDSTLRLNANLALDAGAGDSFTNFNNSGTMSLASGSATYSLTSFTNQAHGSLTILGTAKVTDFENDGTLLVSDGGVLSNIGSSGLTFGGGSTTTVNGATVANEGMPPANAGLIDLGSMNATLSGLLVNDGLVGSIGSPTTVTIDVFFHGVAEGYGSYAVSPDTQGTAANHGEFSPGHSPGTNSVSTFNVSGGSFFQFEVSDATGTAGAADGWDKVLVQGNVFSHVATLNFNDASPANPFVVDIVSLLNSGSHNTPGAADNFSPNQNYNWLFVDGSSSTFVGTFDPADFHLDASGFQNIVNGTFSIQKAAASNTLSIVYTAAANAPTPMIGSFTATPSTVTIGAPLTLTANNVTVSTGSIAGVNFYRESNGIPGLQIGSDTLVAAGTQSGTTWSATSSTTGLAAASYTYYAVAADTVNDISVPSMATVLVTLGTPSGNVETWNMAGQTAFGTQGLLANQVTGVSDTLGLTRGSGVSTAPPADSNAWGGNGWATTSAAGVTGNQFVTFGLTVSAGEALSLSTISLNYHRSQFGPDSALWQYQIGTTGTWVTIGDFSGEFNSDHSSISGVSGTATLSLSTVSGLQNLAAGTAVDFRLVPYAPTSEPAPRGTSRTPPPPTSPSAARSRRVRSRRSSTTAPARRSSVRRLRSRSTSPAPARRATSRSRMPTTTTRSSLPAISAAAAPASRRRPSPPARIICSRFTQATPTTAPASRPSTFTTFSTSPAPRSRRTRLRPCSAKRSRSRRRSHRRRRASPATSTSTTAARCSAPPP